jgi:hypothetical protein
MSSITLDQATVEKLKGLTDRVEVRDPQGQVIGMFRALPRVYREGEEPQISEEEWKRRMTESKRFTTPEVLKRLEELR